MVKCAICKKKISSLMIPVYTCRCKNIYCSKHILSHNCTFDYKKLYKKLTHVNPSKLVENKI